MWSHTNDQMEESKKKSLKSGCHERNNCMRNLLWIFFTKFDHRIEFNWNWDWTKPMNFGRYWDHLLCKSTIDKNRRCNDTMVKCMLLCTRLTEFNINPKWKRNMNDVHRKFGWNPLPIAKWYLLPKKYVKCERVRARAREIQNTMHELLGWTDDDFCCVCRVA